MFFFIYCWGNAASEYMPETEALIELAKLLSADDVVDLERQQEQALERELAIYYT